MSNAQEAWHIPNQYYGLTKQLEDGVRGLLLDTHYFRDAAYLCHTSCILGKETLVSGLSKIKSFMDAHPNEIITIFFESYISPEDTKNAFEKSGLIEYVHSQPKSAPWPTLRQMINSARRLVVFTGNGGGAFPWYHNVWDYTWETKWDVASVADFTCKLDRGKPENSIFIMSHFLDKPFNNPSLAAKANNNPFFLDRARKCMLETGHIPNFISVDFYSIGVLFDVVRSMNGL
jgi:hypothetical protein